jgi:hypothetical protein
MGGRGEGTETETEPPSPSGLHERVGQTPLRDDTQNMKKGSRLCHVVNMLYGQPLVGMVEEIEGWEHGRRNYKDSNP